MILKKISPILVLSGLFRLSANALTISDYTYLGANEAGSQDITIDKDVFLALIEGNMEDFGGSLNVEGSLFIGDDNTGDSGMETSFTGSNLENDGVIVVDNRNVSSGSLTVAWSGTSITNNGEMYFNGPNSDGNAFTLSPSSTLTNNGLIYMGQDESSDYSSSVNLKSSSFTNDGTICLKNVKAYLDSSISGSGCIDIGENTVYAIQSSKSYGSLGPQTLYMSSSSSIIYVDTSGLTDNIKVEGYGNGNYLSFGTSIVSHSYDSDTGILSFSIFIFISHKFNIGTGYDSSQFSEKTIDNHIGSKLVNNALIYSGAPPNGVPSVCDSCKDSPWIPVITVSTTSTTSLRTTTSADSTTTSADPAITFADPTTTSADPTTTSADPTTTSADQITTSADPITTSADPITTSADPTTDPITSSKGDYFVSTSVLHSSDSRGYLIDASEHTRAPSQSSMKQQSSETKVTLTPISSTLSTIISSHVKSTDLSVPTSLTNFHTSRFSTVSSEYQSTNNPVTISSSTATSIDHVTTSETETSSVSSSIQSDHDKDSLTTLSQLMVSTYSSASEPLLTSTGVGTSLTSETVVSSVSSTDIRTSMTYEHIGYTTFITTTHGNIVTYTTTVPCSFNIASIQTSDSSSNGKIIDTSIRYDTTTTTESSKTCTSTKSSAILSRKALSQTPKGNMTYSKSSNNIVVGTDKGVAAVSTITTTSSPFTEPKLESSSFHREPAYTGSIENTQPVFTLTSTAMDKSQEITTSINLSNTSRIISSVTQKVTSVSMYHNLSVQDLTTTSASTSTLNNTLVDMIDRITLSQNSNKSLEVIETSITLWEMNTMPPTTSQLVNKPTQSVGVTVSSNKTSAEQVINMNIAKQSSNTGFVITSSTSRFSVQVESNNAAVKNHLSGSLLSVMVSFLLMYV